MSERRRRIARPDPPGGEGGGEARVHGAWTTPAVVVRGPDGEIVDVPARRGQTGDRPSDRAPARRGPTGGGPSQAGTRPAAAAGGDGGRRVRPRRIPGAPGAVLFAPTLLGAGGDDPAVRRQRRPHESAAVATPLASPGLPRRGSSDRGAGGGGASAWTRLRSAGAATAGAVRWRHGSASERGRGRRGPGRTARGDRRQPLGAALARLNFDRLLPPDDEARARRALRLRRLASTTAVAGLVVVLVYSVFPVRTWIDQRAEADRAREQEEVIERENARLEEEMRDLLTDERIEELAREMGMVKPGEELYGIHPAPEAAPAAPPTTQPPG